MTKPPLEILKLPLEVRAQMALKAAVKKAIEEHARQGRSIFVWRNGKVVEVTAKQLRKELRTKRKKKTRRANRKRTA